MNRGDVSCFSSLIKGSAIAVLSLFLPAMGVAADTASVDPITRFKEHYPGIDQFVVKDLRVQGNERTKPFVIAREMPIGEGDTLQLDGLRARLSKAEKQLLNSRLFNKVRLVPIWLRRGQARIIVGVEERWYTFPTPIFKLADRNFNEWLINRGGDLSRTSYGVRLYQENVRGRNEELQVVTQLGFNQQFGLYYKIPYLDSTSRTGLRFGANYTRSHKTAYQARNQSLQFFNGEDEYINKQFSSEVRLIHRPTIDNGHKATVEFQSNWVAEPIIQKNARYYEGERQTQRFLRLSYQYQRDYRDRVNYPTSGYLLRLEAFQWGLGIFEGPETTAFNGSYQQFKQLGNRWTAATTVAGRYSLPGNQPFSIEKGFGYGKMFVRGYEYYVIQGQDYALNRNDLRYRLFKTHFSLPGIVPEKFRDIPVALRLKAFTDQGVVWDHYTEQEAPNLANQYLFGYGVGVDVTSYYDFNFRLEYAFNDRSESDLFLHFGLPF